MKRMVTEKEIGEVAVDSVQGALDSNTLHIGTALLYLEIVADDLSGTEIVNTTINEKLTAISECVIVGFADNSGDFFVAGSYSYGGAVFAVCLPGGSVVFKKQQSGRWIITYATGTYNSIGDLLDDLSTLEVNIRYIP